MNSPQNRRSWYRFCWMLRSDGRTVEYGTLTGRDVPHMLAGLRDCLPLGSQDPQDVQDAANTPEGWSYASDTIGVHTHHTPVAEPWLSYFACPERENGGTS